MAVFSLVLVGLMVFKIQAFCFFCALSATLAILLLVLAVAGGGWDDPSKLFFRGFLLALAVLLGSLIWASVLDPERPDVAVTGPGAPPLVTPESTPAKVASGGTSHGQWCRDVQRLLVPPLPRSETGVRQGSSEKTHGD